MGRSADHLVTDCSAGWLQTYLDIQGKHLLCLHGWKIKAYLHLFVLNIFHILILSCKYNHHLLVFLLNCAKVCFCLLT